MGLRLFEYILRYRRAVLTAALLFAAAALVHVLVSPPPFSSEALLMPPIEEGGPGLLGAWMASMNLPSMITPMSAGSVTSAVTAEILQSRALAEMAIDSLGLMERYEASNIDEAVAELAARTAVETSTAGLISLAVEDPDPGMARTIARFYIAGLDSLNRRLQEARAAGTMRFTAGQIEDYREKLRESRSRIAEFQQKHGIIDFDEQVKGAIDVAAALKVRAALAEIERDMLREFARTDAGELMQKEMELRYIDRQLGKLMRGDTASAVFVPLEQLPALKAEYAALTRDLEVNERVYSFLLEKHEESGIERARNTPSMQVVDPPSLPRERSGLARWLTVVLAGLAGAVWMSLVLAWWGWITLKEKSAEEHAAYDSLVGRVREDIAALRRRLGI